jgi:type II secretory pathway component PulF
MLKTGREIRDLAKVLPACRQHLKDGVSRTRGALNYLVVLTLVLTPAVPAIALTLLTFVFPKILAILHEMEVPPPAFTAFVLGNAHLLVPVLFLFAVVLYLITFIYVGGPRLTAWLKWGAIPLGDWLAFRLPWRRKQLQRDFGGLLCALLDSSVPEERAVTLAAAGTANALIERRAGNAVSDLRVGVKLPQAIHRLDDSGEFRWRLANASQSIAGFRMALSGWLEALDAKAFQQQQAAAHVITTAFVLVNGAVIGAFVIGTFDVIIAVINKGVLW